MTGVLRWADRVATLLAAIGAILAMTMALFVTLSSVMRYLVGSPFAFTEELVGLLFTAVIFAGIPVCTLRNSHICVTIVPDLMPRVLRRIVDAVANAIVVVFCAWFGMLTLEYLQTTVALDARSAGSRLLLWPWVAVLPASCFLSAVAASIRIVAPAGPGDRVHRGGE